ncbi:hypothetical protein HYT51_01435 [Candidatus Woesearchaeota archaeon]|nr:hypothetical protein [Candidatus Woesearchaeota archaeon]
MNRVIFIDDDSRKSFFDEIRYAYKFDSWKSLYCELHIAKSVFEKYKSGKLTIPYSLYSKMASHLENKEVFSSFINILKANWGNIKGGKTTYAKHKEIFDQGRRKAIEAIKEKALTFDINMPLSEDLAYFLGLFIGDGFTNKYGNHYMFQFIGHKQELGFYKNEVVPIAKRLFNLVPNIKEDNIGNFIRVDYYSSCLFRLTTERFKIERGRKSKTVLVPKEILKSDRKFLHSFIAGLYDAESCVFFDRRKKYTKPYPRIDLHMNNLDILNQIKNALDEDSIVSNVFVKNSRLLIYGEENIRKFLSEIPIKNPKHLDKLLKQKLIH